MTSKINNKFKIGFILMAITDLMALAVSIVLFIYAEKYYADIRLEGLSDFSKIWMVPVSLSFSIFSIVLLIYIYYKRHQNIMHLLLAHVISFAIVSSMYVLIFLKIIDTNLIEGKRINQIVNTIFARDFRIKFTYIAIAGINAAIFQTVAFGASVLSIK